MKMKTAKETLPNKNIVLHSATLLLTPYFWLIVLLTFAAYCRLINITQIGIDGSDTFQYWHIATSWAKGVFAFGDPVKNDPRTFYRPLAYLIYGVTVKFFGHYDFSIRLVNVFANIISIVLIFFIGKKVKSPWLGFFAAVSYSFLSNVLYYCRTELLHILTGTFVLLSVWFFLKAVERNSPKKWFLYLALAGLALSCGANTHPDIAYIAPGYILFLLFYSFAKEGFASKVKDFIINSLVFSMSFFSLYIVGGLCFGFMRIYRGFREIKSVTSTNSSFGAMIKSFPVSFQLRLHKYIVSNVGTEIFFIIFIICIGILLFILCYNFFKKHPFDKDAIGPILFTILIIFYVSGNSLITDKRISPRLFIPMLPLVFISTYAIIYMALKKIPWKYCSIVTVAIISSFIIYNAKVPLNIKRYKAARPSVYREVYNVLGDKVNSQNKLLILPCSIYYAAGFSTISYFGEEAVVYARNCREPFDNFIKRNNIRYIFYVMNKGLVKWRADAKDLITSCYGISPTHNSPQWEYEHFIRNIVGDKKTHVPYRSQNGLLFDISFWYQTQ